MEARVVTAQKILLLILCFAFASVVATPKVSATSPCIIRQPVSQTAPRGTNVTFSVTASGVGPLAYQWRVNGVALNEATNASVIVTNVQASDMGSYTVEVSQPDGVAQSAGATLTVVDHPLYAMDWPDLRLTAVVTNQFPTLRHPYPHITQITHAGDSSGRIFIVGQFGGINVFASTGLIAIPFLDISDRVLTPPDLIGEQGLLSVAFPPCYSSKGYFYVNYTRLPDGATVVSRFSVTSSNANVADPQSEQVLLTIPQPYANHNGGQLMFGPDGFLYIGMGDGGSEGDPNNQGQNPGSLLGKMLRIDVESVTNGYVVPSSNPFVGQTGYRPEIWAIGFRNPWRFSFDRFTGDLYIGDVGQDLWEEIDFQPASSPGGENYGWRIKEASHDYNVPSEGYVSNSLTLPTAEYGHNLGCSVIGGFVYRGPSNPRMQGMYFYADWCSARIWGLKHDGTNWQNRELARTNSYPTTFGEDETGRLYVTDTVTVFRIDDSGLVYPPSFSPASGILNSQSLVTVTCPTPGVTIHYTSDGRDPTEADPTISSGDTILVSSNNTTVKAQAYRSDLRPSVSTTATYRFVVATPAFLPPSGPITNGTRISISSATPDAVVGYTTDGSEPNLSSPVYSAPFAIPGDTTVKAKGFREGFSNSATRTTFYALVTVATPDLNPPSGPITNQTPISITCATPNVLIRYTVDGSDPQTNSLIYSAPFRINGNTTVKARAYRSEYHDSGIRSVFYPLVRVATPIFAPATGPITNGRMLSISCSTPDGVIHYTLNGTDPTNDSPTYNTPLTLSGNVTLKAFALRDGYDPSYINSTVYRLKSLDRTVVTTFAGSRVAGFRDGSAVLAQFNTPYSICSDRNDNIYVADAGNNRIRKISTSGQVTTIAGSGAFGEVDGVNANAQFATPAGVCVDPEGNLYVADRGRCGGVRKIAPNGTVTTIAYISSCNLNSLWQMEIDPSHNLYVGKWATVQKVTPQGVYWAIAGSGGNGSQGWYADVGIGIDAQTNIYAATGAVIYKFSASGDGGLFAGNEAVYADGDLTVARFETPRDVASDRFGNLYISEVARIRKIASNGWVSTFAGSSVAGFANGPGASAQFNEAAGLCIDSVGNVYVADPNNHCIRKIWADQDEDGIPDLIEGQNNPFVVGVDDRLVDSDGDGESNASEYLAGTDPRDPNSFFGLRNVARVNNSCVGFEWPSASNRIYFVEWSSDLQNWTTFDSLTSAQPQVLRVTNCPAANVSSRFYRVRVSTP